MRAFLRGIGPACAVIAGLSGPAAGASSYSTPDSVRSALPAPASEALFGARDLWFGAACIGVTALAAHNDVWLTDETVEAHSHGEHDLSVVAQPFGNAGLIAPALLVAYGAASLAGSQTTASAVVRIGASVATAGAVTVVLKAAVGRSRPIEAPGDPDVIRPVSGHASMPSGHAAVAFATAAALDYETHSPWVPRLAYPAAALVAWSRVHDREHWTSDVVVGAAIGAWTANKVEKVLHRHDAAPLGLTIEPGPQVLRLGATCRF